MPIENATFHTFKTSGKWRYSGRGCLSAEVFKVFTHSAQRAQILKDNGGLMPGMNSTADDLIVVVIGDDDLPHGFPLHLIPIAS